MGRGLSKVLLLSGPTAAGKSTAAVRLAQQLGGEIICADSAQVYKFLDAATGKPTAQEREAVRHHVIDVADPARPVFTAGDFYRAAEEAAAGVIQRGRVPMVVGGAWLYLRFFLYGLPATVKPSEDIRRVAETLTKHHWPSWDSALSLLRVVDRPTAEKLPRNDWRKFQRALEVYFTAGKPMSQVDRQGAAPGSEDRKHLHRYDFRCVFLALGWSQLRRNAELRCEQFLRPGQLLEETVRLLCSGKLLVDTPPGRAIGYRQMIDALQHMARSNRGAFNDDDAASAAAAVAEAIFSATCRLLRRQMQFFAQERQFMWVDASNPEQLQEDLNYIWGCDRSKYEELLSNEEYNDVRLRRHRNLDISPRELRAKASRIFRSRGDAIHLGYRMRRAARLLADRQQHILER